MPRWVLIYENHFLVCKASSFAPRYQFIIFFSEDGSYFVPVINSSPPVQNDRHFADDTFRCTFVNEKFYILIKISLNFVPKGPIDNNLALV